jgi:hypothetical protein
VPVVALAVAALDITGAGTLITIDNVLLPVPPLLVALIVTLKLPDAVGVPLITPVDVFILNPDGKLVAV